MFKLKKFLLMLLLSELSGIAISFLIYLFSKTFDYFEINLTISLIFSNSIGLIYYLISSIFKYYIAGKLQNTLIKFFLKFFVLFASLFLSFEIAYFIIRYFFKMAIFPDYFEIQNFLLVINIILFSVLIIFVIIYQKLRIEIEKKNRENENLRRLQTESKLVALQSKINPHFLFNTLNSIIELAYESPRKVETVVLNLSNIYRKILYLADKQFFSVSEEIELIKSYLEIEKIRMGIRLNYELNIDPNILTLKIPPLIIEPIVENSVIHGIGPKPEGGKITVTIEKKENNVIISVSDTGVGIKENNLKQGYGTSSVKERLGILYKNKFTFEIKNHSMNDSGTDVTIIIPYKEA
ncbi:MAG TPA: histidine kinase [Petrotogaceae bacterium]|nr:histidine kinase [Petrotogaceae bacterium]